MRRIDRADAWPGVTFRARFGRQAFGQHVEAVDAGGEAADALEVLDDQRNGAEHGSEGTGRLDGTADFQFAGEHVVGHDGAGNDQGEQEIALLEEVEPELATDQALEVAEGGAEAALDLAEFERLATVEGDRFGVFPD